MQTFLPYPDFDKSAGVLDRKRLGKQRIEALQIYRALTVKGYGWQHHPITKMWKGHEAALLDYGLSVVREWKKRGYRDAMEKKFLKERKKHAGAPRPAWLGRKGFHASHRSNLLRKNKKHYKKFGWKEPDNLPYVWVV